MTLGGPNARHGCARRNTKGYPVSAAGIRQSMMIAKNSLNQNFAVGAHPSHKRIDTLVVVSYSQEKARQFDRSPAAVARLPCRAAPIPFAPAHGPSRRRR